MKRLPWRWLVLVAAAIYACIATWSLANAQAPKVFSAGDTAAGAKMHEKDCVACHVRQVGGDGTRMYTRAERRVTTPEKLKAQIAYCNTELDAGYFPEDEDHVAAYLNLHFYKFKE